MHIAQNENKTLAELLGPGCLGGRCSLREIDFQNKPPTSSAFSFRLFNSHYSKYVSSDDKLIDSGPESPVPTLIIQL